MFTIEGSFKYVTDVKTGAKRSGDGTWKNTQFVVEASINNYPTEIAFNIWEEEIQIPTGSWVKIEFYPRSSMYNNKYYTNLVAKSINVIGVSNQQPQPYAQPQYQHTPQQQKPHYPPQQQTQTQKPVMPEQQQDDKEFDDMPF